MRWMNFFILFIAICFTDVPQKLSSVMIFIKRFYTKKKKILYKNRNDLLRLSPPLSLYYRDNEIIIMILKLLLMIHRAEEGKRWMAFLMLWIQNHEMLILLQSTLLSFVIFIFFCSTIFKTKRKYKVLKRQKLLTTWRKNNWTVKIKWLVWIDLSYV